MTLQTFFDGYGEALTARDSDAIAKHWAVPSIVLGPDGAIAVSAAEEVVAFFDRALAQYDGVAQARPNLVRTTELLPGLTACELEWDHLDADGARVGGEKGYYVVRQSGAGEAIEVYAPRD